MTFEDDFIQVLFEGGMRRFKCVDLGVEWPPPEEVNVMGFMFKRTRYSQITDEQREGMTFVARGAEYEPVEKQ